MAERFRIAVAMALGLATIVPAAANDAHEDSKNLRQNQTSSAGTGLKAPPRPAPKIKPVPQHGHRASKTQ